MDAHTPTSLLALFSATSLLLSSCNKPTVTAHEASPPEQKPETTSTDSVANQFAALGEISFNEHVRPILSDTCFHCHGPDKNKQEAGFAIHTFQDATAELTQSKGKFGITPGDPEKSEIIKLIFESDEDYLMPPADSIHKLSETQKHILKAWVAQGAKYEDHWAFTHPKKTPPAPTRDQNTTNWVKNTIDSYVAEKHHQHKLTPSPPAKPEVWLRRVTLSLTGVQPTPQELSSFISDSSATAKEKAVDRLLASPRYGEHMAVAWMEAARYADTDGFQNDHPRENWPWRDYVIKSFNENKGFDQFTIEQIAGDMLTNPTHEQLVATAYNRNHRQNAEGGALAEEFRVENTLDRVDTVGTTYFALTMSCARCHDHKYDPLSQKEFFAFSGYFNNLEEKPVTRGTQSKPILTSASLFPELHPDIPQAKLMVSKEAAKPRSTYLLERGQYDSPDKSESLTNTVPKILLGNHPAPKNRLELAQWMMSEHNPITARVIVNRMWIHHFGNGLCSTPEDFGSQAAYPSHPKLLDWLAVEFRESGWNLKHIHKLITLSATYGQSSKTTPNLLEQDRDNKWLARGPRFRLSGYTIRDQALFASNALHEKLGGPSVKPYQPHGLWNSVAHNKNIFYKASKGQDLYRRSLYTYWKRAVNPPRQLLFDAASRELCSVTVNRTNTPLQALVLMNDETFLEAARLLAESVITDQSISKHKHAESIYQKAIGYIANTKTQTILQNAHQHFINYYTNHPQEAEAFINIGNSKPISNYPAAELAALTAVAHIVMNTDEMLNIE
ncbi:PSD1 and planctomycete cytochrome C domain-containing protein [Rubritalea tangerina]|uniref:PSD1 and planctomycete cytochrome C domain-containing protein n=1 Tax=Rubritalea tangerina TaxID=430798 RepID=UPI003618B209